MKKTNVTMIADPKCESVKRGFAAAQKIEAEGSKWAIVPAKDTNFILFLDDSYIRVQMRTFQSRQTWTLTKPTDIGPIDYLINRPDMKQFKLQDVLSKPSEEETFDCFLVRTVSGEFKIKESGETLPGEQLFFPATALWYSVEEFHIPNLAKPVPKLGFQAGDNFKYLRWRKTTAAKIQEYLREANHLEVFEEDAEDAAKELLCDNDDYVNVKINTRNLQHIYMGSVEFSFDGTAVSGEFENGNRLYLKTNGRMMEKLTGLLGI